MTPTFDTLGPMPSAAGVELLCGQVRELAPEPATAITELLRGEPLALSLAAAWLRETTTRLRGKEFSTEKLAAYVATEYQSRIKRRLDDGARDVNVACLAVTLEDLSEEPLGRLAVRLLELCAWLAPEGVGHRLLASAPFLQTLTRGVHQDEVKLIEDDSLVLDQVLWLCARYGLAELVWSKKLLRMHRVVQELFRERRSARERREQQQEVLATLAQILPPRVEGPVQGHPELYTELRRHLPWTEIVASRAPALREWLVLQVSFEAASGDRGRLPEMVRIVDSALEHWPDDPLKGRLYGQQANLLLDLGEFGAARAAAERARELLRPAGLAGEYASLAAQRGGAAALRGLGMFDPALGQITGAYDRTRDLFGADHRDTIIAELNLAEAAYLAGRHARALSTAQDALAKLEGQFGLGDWLTARTAVRVGEYLCLFDHLNEARQLLSAHLDYAGTMPTPDPTAVLHLRQALGVVLRRQSPGRTPTRLNEVWAGFRNLLGPDHPHARAAQFSLAIELAVRGRTPRAAVYAEQCWHAFRRRHGDEHPFVLLCRLGYGAFLLDDRKPEVSVETLTEVREAFERTLGVQHPWTIVACLHLSRALSVLGRHDEARRLGQDAADSSEEYLGDEHPYHRAARAALKDSDGTRSVAPGRPRPVIYLDVPLV